MRGSKVGKGIFLRMQLFSVDLHSVPPPAQCPFSQILRQLDPKARCEKVKKNFEIATLVFHLFVFLTSISPKE